MLFGALSLQEQDLALAPSPAGRRRVVLATDIAETSLTVEGIRVVIDSSQVRSPHYDSRSGLTRLRTGASRGLRPNGHRARRSRRAGVALPPLVQDGTATRRPHADPEIISVDLTGFALEAGGRGHISRRPDVPGSAAAPVARRCPICSTTSAALDADGIVTDAGGWISELPVHPRLARMVTAGADLGFGSIACSLAAMLKESDILRGRPDELPPTSSSDSDSSTAQRKTIPASIGRPCSWSDGTPVNWLAGRASSGAIERDRSDDRARVGPGLRLPGPCCEGPRQRPIPNAQRRRRLATRG